MEKEQVWDPLRKKNVALTPEEKVRQWFIGILRTEMEVPPAMMMSEVSMEFGQEIGALSGVARRKTYRADILVYDRNLKPLVIVECKRPEVELSVEVFDQALRYNMVLGVRYLIVTNGRQTRMYSLKDKAFLSSIPKYLQIIND